VSPRRILVRGPNWLGDLVMSTPGFRALREAFPADHITLHARAELLPLLEGAPWFDATRPLESYHRGLPALLGEARALRRSGSFDLGVCVPDSWSSALLMRAAGVRRIVGHARGGRGWLLHDAVDLRGAAGARRLVPREQHVLELAERVGAPAAGSGLELFTTPAEEQRARRVLEDRGVDPARERIALAPGASFGPSKHWPAASFARVGDAAAERGLDVLILGAPGEEALAGRVREAMRAPAAVLAGHLDLGALKAVIRGLRALVCNDAGARHVAVAFGVPCAVLFGPTAVEKTAWNLERVQVIERSDVPCRPCYERACPIDHRCMTRIAPLQVIDALDACLLASAGSRGLAEGGRRRAENAGT